MNTAKTLQLLDANNNNISPAVCVDSLYFEQANTDGTTYRMSLKNRTLVAAENMQSYSATSGGNLEDIKVPYCYVQAVTGTGGMVYQLNTSEVSIGHKIKETLNLDSYLLKTDAANNYIEKWPNTLYVGKKTNSETTDAQVTVQSIDKLYSKIDFNAGGTTCFVYNNTTDHPGILLTSNNKVSLNSSNGAAQISAKYDIGIDTSAGINVTSKDNMKIISQDGSIYVRSAETRFDSSVNIFAGIDTSVSFEKSIKLFPSTGNNYIYLYEDDYVFPKKVGNESKYMFLSINRKYKDIQNTSTGMAWLTMPGLILADSMTPSANSISYMRQQNYGTDGLSPMDVSVYIKPIVFNSTGGNYETISLLSESANQQLEIRNLAVRTSGGSTEYYSINNDGTSKSIYVKTVANNSLLTTNSSDEMNIPVVLETNDTYKNHVSITIEPASGQTYYLLSTTEQQKEAVNNNKSGNMYYTTGIYYNSTGNMYAAQYMASSDERLKDNISEIDVETAANFPEIKQFNWKSDGKKSYGFIAQELETAGFEELVEEDKDGYKRVNYDAALSLSVAKLQQENKELRSQVADLTEKVNMLLAKLS